MLLGKIQQFVILGLLGMATPSFALNDYVGALAPFVGAGLDANSNAKGMSYLGGIRMESTTIENHLSLVVGSMLSINNSLPVSSTVLVDNSAKVTYLFMGGALRFEDVLLQFGENENATGLYYDIGLGAYYGYPMIFTKGTSKVSLTSSELKDARVSTKVIDTVINVGFKLLLDFNKSFGVYPYFDYELIPMRTYFKTTYTDTHMKQRFFLGMGFAFAWD